MTQVSTTKDTICIDFSTDSISMFGDMDHNELEEVDESEETVLMSLKGMPVWVLMLSPRAVNDLSPY